MVAQNIGFPNGDPRNAGGRALGVELRPEAAGALLLLNAAYFVAFGVNLIALEGLRNLDRQNFYWDRYVNRHPGWTVAARPGTSMHGWALALDFGGPIQSSATLQHAWLARNAPTYGWEWTGRNFGEPWHFDYTGVNVTAAQRAAYIAAGTGGTITTRAFSPLLQEVPMIRAQQKDAGASAKTFGISIGATHISPAENAGLEEYARELRAKSSNGYPVEPLQLSSSAITHVSNVGRRAAFTDEIRAKVDAIAKGQILFPGAPYNAFEAIVGVMRERSGQAPIEIDEKLLGESLAAALKPTIANVLRELALEGAQADDIGELVARRVVESQSVGYEVPDVDIDEPAPSDEVLPDGDLPAQKA